MHRKYLNQYFKTDGWYTPSVGEKSVDKLYDTMYNDGKGTSQTNNDTQKKNEPDTIKRFGFTPEIDSWAKKNSDAIRYAGDGAINSIKKATKDYLNKYLKDAPKETDKDELFGSIAKWQLARDANDDKLGNVAMNNIIGHMSTENKDHYLKEQIPFSEYVNAKDDFDYKTGKYTTTEYASKAADKAVKMIQQKLNEKGSTDKYGNKLKEDGLVGSKTLQAYDSFEKDEKKKEEPKRTDNKYNVDVSKIKKIAPGEYQYGGLLITNNGTKFASAGGPMPLEDMDMDTVVKAIQDYNGKNSQTANTYALKVDKETGDSLPEIPRTSVGGKLSAEDENKDYSESKKTLIKGMSACWWKKDGNDETQKKEQGKIATQGVKLRKFNDSTFNRAIFLNNSSGAGKNGHSAIMLMNEDNYAMIFSFYPTKETLKDALSVKAEMRFSVLTPNQANRVLYGDGWAFDMVASDGEIQDEEYDHFAYYDITSENGKIMYDYAVELFDDPGNYSLFGRQCDYIVAEIFRIGGIEIDTKLKPNNTYEGLDAHKWERKEEYEK